MEPKSGDALQLPKFRPDAEQRRWITDERRTADLIRTLWKAAGKRQRKEPAFLQLIVQLGWVNGGSREATRRWRNRRIAKYLNVTSRTDEQLAQKLHSRFRSLAVSQCLAMLKEQTGIAWYFNPYRPATLAQVKSQSRKISRAFEEVSARAANANEKVRRVADLIGSLGHLRVTGKTVDPFKGLSPALSCLDPQQKFPMMNKRTHAWLKYSGQEADKEGIVALSKLIGRRYGIVRDARELDVYVNTHRPPRAKQKTVTRPPTGNDFKGIGKPIGLKSEISSLAQIAAKKTTIRKVHNKLINDLNDYLLWRHLTAKESKFDALVIGWKKGRDLLIEAKTASEGMAGRSQIRQAIGQLYDYRFTFMPHHNVDLAILLPKEPRSDIKKLIGSLHIELLWFKGKKLTGTIHL